MLLLPFLLCTRSARPLLLPSSLCFSQPQPQPESTAIRTSDCLHSPPSSVRKLAFSCIELPRSFHLKTSELHHPFVPLLRPPKPLNQHVRQTHPKEHELSEHPQHTPPRIHQQQRLPHSLSRSLRHHPRRRVLVRCEAEGVPRANCRSVQEERSSRKSVSRTLHLLPYLFQFLSHCSGCEQCEITGF